MPEGNEESRDVRCDYCGTQIEQMPGHRDGFTYCPECAEEFIVHCSRCGCAHEADDSLFGPNDGHTAERLCPDCFYELCAYCEDCGEALWVAEARDRGQYDSNGIYCSYCHHECHCDYVNSYDYEPPLTFYGNYGKGRPTFGVETEINCGNSLWSDCTRRVSSYGPDDFFYFMEDGSLEDGFEIATMPFTLEYMHEHKETWDGLFGLQKLGCSAYSSYDCGTHVHIGKDTFFGQFHQLKFTKFFYRNPRFITEISRRAPGPLEEWASLNEPPEVVSVLKNKTGYIHKYKAVNVGPAKTIEVRVFRGTISPIGYFANVEFCHAVFQFTGIASLRDLTLDNFIPYVYSNKKLYPYLVGSMGSSLPMGERG